MRKFGLIGYPLGHSFSKQYFSGKFIRDNIQGCAYDLYPLERVELFPELIENEPFLEGLNVTIPYKSDIIKYLQEVSPEASEIGAVNVVKISRTGNRVSLKGFNSDVFGFISSLKPYLLPGMNTAIVLGTGGGSRAVVYGLRKLGFRIILVSREKGENRLTYNELESNMLKDAHVIVNTTPLGMYPNINTLPDIDYSSLIPGQILFDLVYNPEKSLFLNEGEERGCKVINGLEMLHLQAEKAWEIWNNLGD